MSIPQRLNKVINRTHDIYCVNLIGKAKGIAKLNDTLEPRESVKKLLDATNVHLPKSLPCSTIHVTTKKKLQSSRNNA